MRSRIDQTSINKTIKKHVKKHTEIQSTNSSKMDPRTHPKSTNNRSRGHLGPRNAPKMVQERPRILILTVLERFSIDFGTILDRLWDDFGPILGRCFVDFGTIQKPFAPQSTTPPRSLINHAPLPPTPCFVFLWSLPFDFDSKSIT